MPAFSIIVIASLTATPASEASIPAFKRSLPTLKAPSPGMCANNPIIPGVSIPNDFCAFSNES